MGASREDIESNARPELIRDSDLLNRIYQVIDNKRHKRLYKIIPLEWKAEFKEGLVLRARRNGLRRLAESSETNHGRIASVGS